MRTAGCVLQSSNDPGSNEFIISDSAFFMAPDACLKLLEFYNKHNPLKCEVDAYGDFLQVIQVNFLRSRETGRCK